MSGLRTIALMEAERLALVEALNAMTQLADVRERMYSEERDESKDLYHQILAAEKSSEEWQEKHDELKKLLLERQAEHDAATVKQDEPELRILGALEKFFDSLHPYHVRHGRDLLNAALAEGPLF